MLGQLFIIKKNRFILMILGIFSHIFKCFGDKYIIGTSEGFNSSILYKIENINNDN